MKIEFSGVSDAGFDCALAERGPRYALRMNYRNWRLPWQLYREYKSAWGLSFDIVFSGTEAQCFGFMLRDMEEQK